MKYIRKTIAKALNRIPVKAYYITAAIMVLPAYYWGWQLLTDESTSFVAIMSQLTVNFVVFLFLFGNIIERYTKKMPRLKGWLVWALAMVVVVLIFYASGMETIFG
jgi:hypothetical protein